MTKPISFDGQVAIVTGAGAGLGRAHARALAARGARGVVNDLGPGAQAVADEITASGGVAHASQASVTDPQAIAAMVAQALDDWGRIDILINNAGILRDKSFAKQTLDTLDAVIDVHLRGSWICTQAVWGIMRDQGYGRVLLTSSSSGIHGNFGQANYAAAKAAMIGLMNTLHIEGEKYGIRVNCLAPAALTAMTRDLLPADAARVLAPERVAPGALFLVSPEAPSKVILGAGAGGFSIIRIEETAGLHLGDAPSVDDVAAHWDDIRNQQPAAALPAAWAQTQNFVALARRRN